MSLLVEIGLDVLAPIFLLMAVGAALGRAFPLHFDTLGKLNIYAFVPALMFIRFVKGELTLDDTGTIGLAWLLITMVMGALAAAGNALARIAPKLRPVVSLGAMFPNSGNYGIPAADLAFGPAGGAVQAVVLAADNLLFFTVGVFTMSGGAARWRAALRSVVRMPILWAVLAAFVFRSRRDWLPGPAETALGLLGSGLVPVALVTLGAQLAQGAPRTGSGAIALTTGLRLVAGPLAGWLVARFLALPPHLAVPLIAAAGYPCAVNTVVLALEFKRAPAVAAATVFWSTLGSLLTVSAVIALVR